MKAVRYLGKKRTAVFEEESLAPGPQEVTIRVAWCGICGTDLHILHGAMDSRMTLPQVFGHEMSGTVMTAGAEVKGFAVGDRVTVRPVLYASDERDWPFEGAHIRPGMKFMGIDTPGAFQETWTVPASTLHHLPPGLGLDLAAMVEPLAVACHDVRIAGLQPGESTVVLGGGPIGALIALVARAYGARVSVSEIDSWRRSFLAGLGLACLDPVSQDLNAHVQSQTGGHGADVVFEATGNPSAAKVMTALPRIRGRIVAVGIFPQPVALDLKAFFLRELRLFGARIYDSHDFEAALALAAGGTLPLDRFITQRIALDQLSPVLASPQTGQGMKVLVRCGGE